MLYKVLRPVNDGPPVLIDYITICDVKIGSMAFIHRALVNNKIVPSNWFEYKELLYAEDVGSEIIVRQRTGQRRDVLYMYPLEKEKLPKPKDKVVYAKFDTGFINRYADFPTVRFQPINVPAPMELQPLDLELELGIQPEAIEEEAFREVVIQQEAGPIPPRADLPARANAPAELDQIFVELNRLAAQTPPRQR
jgi:hypothetical protein